MKFSKTKFYKLLNNYYPLIFFIGVLAVFFWKVFLLKLVPIPADLIVGAYFPWLDYKWGYDVGVPVKNLITSDVVSVIYPIKSLMIDLMRKGVMPLWNPLMFGGYPLLANFQVAFFSPVSLFYLFLPKITAWTVQIILQPLFSMLFSYLLLRYFKLSKTSSILGSVVYAFSGFSLVWMEWGAHGFTAAFIPLILYLSSKFVDTTKIYWGVLLSVAVTFQIFSGYPQLLAYTLLSVFIYLLIVKRQSLRISLILKISLYIVLGIALSAIQFIPAVELLSVSQRVGENLSYDLIYLPWQNWISFLAPDFFGNHATGNFWGEGNYTNNVGYSGLVSLCLAAFATIYLKKNKLVTCFSIIFVISLLFSFPFPWSKYLYSLNLPGIGASSLTRILVLTNFSISILSAFGLEAFMKGKTKKLSIISAVVSLIIFVIAIISYFKFKNGELTYLVGLKNLFVPVALATSVFIMSILSIKFKKHLKFFVIIIVLISIFELFRFGWKFIPFSSSNLIYPDTSITDYLKNKNELDRIHFAEVIPMNMWMNFNLSSLAGYDAVYPYRISKYIAVLNSNDPNATVMGRYGSVDNINSRLFDLANMKYLMSLTKHEVKSTKFTTVFEDKSVRILENKNVLPRIFFVSDWEVINDDKKVLEKLIDPKFDLKNKIILSQEFNGFDRNTKPSIYKISDVLYGSNEISLKLKSDSDGFLFISDTYYPGWTSYVDNVEVNIYRADYTFRAIPVEKGEHKIMFIYNPKSFRIGKLISISTLLILFLILIYGYKKNR